MKLTLKSMRKSAFVGSDESAPNNQMTPDSGKEAEAPAIGNAEPSPQQQILEMLRNSAGKIKETLGKANSP